MDYVLYIDCHTTKQVAAYDHFDDFHAFTELSEKNT